jgi:flavin reductase (DIM6/NTAB) family NADH-FMN oxidoreductase RutF
MVALDRGSQLLALVRRIRAFGVNVQERSQAEVATAFAREGGAPKFSGGPRALDGGVPRLEGVGGFLRCTVEEFVAGGDHMIMLGSVCTAEANVCAPLTYYARAFGTHAVPCQDR